MLLSYLLRHIFPLPRMIALDICFVLHLFSNQRREHGFQHEFEMLLAQQSNVQQSHVDVQQSNVQQSNVDAQQSNV